MYTINNYKMEDCGLLVTLEDEKHTVYVEKAWKFNAQSCIQNGTYEGMIRSGLIFGTDGYLRTGQKLYVHSALNREGKTVLHPSHLYKTHGVHYPEEGQRQENKLSLSCLPAAEITLIGMANSEGGQVTFGVSDQGLPIGINKDIALRNGQDGVENYIRTHFKQTTTGYSIYQRLGVRFETTDNGQVLCHVTIPAASSEPILYHGNVLPIRVGNQTHRLHLGRDLVQFVMNYSRRTC